MGSSKIYELVLLYRYLPILRLPYSIQMLSYFDWLFLLIVVIMGQCYGLSYEG